MKTPLWWKRWRIHRALRQQGARELWDDDVWVLTQDTVLPYFDSGFSIRIRTHGYRLDVIGDLTFGCENDKTAISL